MIIYLVCHFSLSQFERQVSHAHQPKVDWKCHYREGDLNLIIFLRIQNQKEKDDCEHILKMCSGVKHKVPETKASLVSICEYFVWVLDLIRDHLMEFAAFELHLLLIELIFNDVAASLNSPIVLVISLLLVIDLWHWGWNTLARVAHVGIIYLVVVAALHIRATWANIWVKIELAWHTLVHIF